MIKSKEGLVQIKDSYAAAFVISVDLSEIWPIFIALNPVHHRSWESPQMIDPVIEGKTVSELSEGTSQSGAKSPGKGSYLHSLLPAESKVGGSMISK